MVSIKKFSQDYRKEKTAILNKKLIFISYLVLLILLNCLINAI
jgi:hypothetical protein